VEVRSIKRRIGYVLDEEDEKAVQIFNRLGMPKNMAKMLLYLSQVPECKSADIERCANMRQPEVSLVMQELLRRGWVKKRDLKKKGKGRPLHIYESAVDLSAIVKTFEQEKLQEFETIKSDLSELKNIIESR
jgi:predicted transcriptional regulator